MKDPYSLILAADTRFSPTNYANDIIWELHPGAGDPPAWTLETTLGLRARLLRLYPRFHAVSDPADFVTPPQLQESYPNYAAFEFEPMAGIAARMEYWVPASQVIAGRLTLTNQRPTSAQFDLEWVGQLNPLGKGQGFTAASIGSSTVLHGLTHDLTPVLFLTGGAQEGSTSQPSLIIPVQLATQAARQFIWALAVQPTLKDSLLLAQRTTAAAWDSEITRIQMTNHSQQIQIDTGNPHWNAALSESQKIAAGLFFSATPHLPQASFVLSRLPDQGYSARGDGSDYPYAWNGQTALDAWYLAHIILPGGALKIAGLVENFLSVQNADGWIDWKPGLAGQRSQHLAQPLLAALAYETAPHLKNPQEWLAHIYPGLLRFIQAWFAPKADPDGDGYPQWSHPLQTGLEDSPIYDRWNPNGQGLEIQTLECPGLAALLYHECRSLTAIAQQLERSEDIAWLQAQCSRLQTEVNASWDEQQHTYRYRDAVTHQTLTGKALRPLQGSGKFTFRQEFNSPTRLVARIHPKQENTRAFVLTLTGETDGAPHSETILARDFTWSPGGAFATTRHIYTRLDQVTIQGLMDEDSCQLAIPDYTQEDISLLLPWWAGITTPHQAQQIIQFALPRYQQPGGLSACPLQPGLPPSLSAAPWIWNTFLIEALLRDGFGDQAAALLGALLDSSCAALQQQHAFRQFYHAVSGTPAGERNMLAGLPPVGLFLRACGIEKISDQEIILRNFNSFSGSVTVQYHGVTLHLNQQETIIQFTTGQTVTLTTPGMHRVTLK